MNYVLHERDLPAHPELASLVAELDAAEPPIGYERLLYRQLFILPELRAYVRVIQDESARLLVPLHLDNPDVHAELVRYCNTSGYHLLVIDGYREWLAEGARLVPVGVWHDIPLAGFKLEGARMRKLRYLVQKFAALGDVRVEEFRPSSLPAAGEAMREIMKRWAAAKGMVIQHSAVCMEDLLRGTLPPAHRAFLTYHGETLRTIIVIECTADETWIMDQEFYDPETAPLGHMEYSVVHILERLRAEGAEHFSLGLTWNPFPFEADPRNDPAGWAWLSRCVEKGTLLTKVFDEGRANHQFKRKFAPNDQPFFVYFRDDMPFEILLKFWPIFMRNSLKADRIANKLDALATDTPVAVETSPSPETPEGRQALLHKAGSLHSLDWRASPLDLQTDSWWQKVTPVAQKPVNKN